MAKTWMAAVVAVAVAIAAVAEMPSATAFQTLISLAPIRPIHHTNLRLERSCLSPGVTAKGDDSIDDCMFSRRAVINSIHSFAAASILLTNRIAGLSEPANAEEKESMFAPKFVQTYEDFTISPEGWSYKDVKVGGGESPKDGDRAVFDWSGYTIGYFGRPFEAKGGPQGGAFDKELDYFRTILGSHTLIPGLESALRTMKPGGIRQIIIPYGPFSYPPTDMAHEAIGPKPTTFSGMRALNFVLENPRVDRTLLFNVKLVRVDRGDGKGGFVRESK